LVWQGKEREKKETSLEGGCFWVRALERVLVQRVWKEKSPLEAKNYLARAQAMAQEYPLN
jgi:hypothetical protein